MSRLGKLPISIPDGVEVKIAENEVTVKGPKGTISQDVMSDVRVEIDGNQVRFVPASDKKATRARWGLYRMLVYNMVTGVSTGFNKTLEIVGVG
ncbi:MAG: 50S ribosomal protein L6, partial [Chitinivibrionales bacterium]|nr:50S ribosomal protein L6 [Chitinivibrionales bacterium]